MRCARAATYCPASPLGGVANRYVPLGLILLAPVIVNIVLYHAFLDRAGLSLAIVTVILWLLAVQRVRPAFAGLLQQRA
jgi:hypothetical protein